MPPTPHRQPHQADIDVFGMTHLGLARAENQDHFLIASMQKALRVASTSLDPAAFDEIAGGSRGYLFCVADGVGSGVSSASALPIAGRAAMITIWPGCRPLVSSSRSVNPVGTPTISPSRLEMASISSSADSMIALSGA